MNHEQRSAASEHERWRAAFAPEARQERRRRNAEIERAMGNRDKEDER
jgi:hypothetical protein